MRTLAALLVFLALCAGTAFAQSFNSEDFTLASPDGTWLGCFNKNAYATDSIFNPYGTYGSRYSPTSIWNEYGPYGGRYSDRSPFNPYAAQPPLLLHQGRSFGRLTVNSNLAGAVDPLQFLVFLRNQAR